ncbi:hypothetical protein V5O48_006090 [Marasmius crinis-equi]|uniref:Cytochrome P450 n=1 Tax=Marasmius crinis-equi TaxID=585013 RepID=A0ABR3FKP4_9AGAR
MEPLVLSACFLTVILLWFTTGRTRKRQGFPLPPGPPADPLIGHLRIIPSQNTSEAFYEWSKIYGDVMYLKVLGREIIVLGSVKSAQALLEGRSANYSCRPKFTVLEVMGWEPLLGFMQYGKRFLKHRKMLQHYLSQKQTISFNNIIAEEARLLVKNLANAKPGRHLHYAHRYTVSNIMRAAFGHQIKSDDDVFLEIANGVAYAFSNCGPPGNTPVDFFPWLLHLPSWFPGTYYANVARSHFKTIRKLYDVPLEFVQAAMKTKNYEKCFASEQLQELGDSRTEDPEAVDDIKGAAASIFSGGVDTTFAALQAFYLAMVHHPEYQKRAYEEIVSVVGEKALPDLSNRESLPFVDAIAQEVFRWNTIGPIGIPHRAINDDIYNDMYIPKGAMVVANIRGMSLNENVYSNPKAFDPSRFLPQPQGKGEPPFPSGFGFGRRICPGRHFADITLWNAIACTLATLEILPVKGADGKLPEMVFSEALVR